MIEIFAPLQNFSKAFSKLKSSTNIKASRKPENEESKIEKKLKSLNQTIN